MSPSHADEEFPLPATRITLGQVARELGVAPSTVSRALSGKGRINPETRERIRAAAESLGYREDALISTLMTQLKQGGEREIQTAMAWLNFAPDREYFAKGSPAYPFWASAKKHAARLGYDLTEFWMGDPQLRVSRLNQILEARGIEGVLIAPYACFDLEWNLDWSRLAPVAIEFTPFQQELPRIGAYDYYNVCIAVNQLEARGHRRIGYVVRPLHETNQFYIMQARFAITLMESQAGEAVHPLVLPIQPGREDLDRFRNWLREEKPSAILTNVNELYPWLRNDGFSVPKDIALAHQDVCLSPPEEQWSGINPQYAAISRRAVQELSTRLQHRWLGISERAESTYIKGTWQDGLTAPYR